MLVLRRAWKLKLTFRNRSQLCISYTDAITIVAYRFTWRYFNWKFYNVLFVKFRKTHLCDVNHTYSSFVFHPWRHITSLVDCNVNEEPSVVLKWGGGMYLNYNFQYWLLERWFMVIKLNTFVHAKPQENVYVFTDKFSTTCVKWYCCLNELIITYTNENSKCICLQYEIHWTSAYTTI